MATPPKPLSSRIAVITGASSGIGEALARDFAAQGAKLVLNARRADRLAALKRELGPERVATVQGDAADQSVIDSLLDTAKSTFGRDADLVIVNAGRGLRGSVTDSDTAQWEQMIRINLLGAARLMRSAAKRLSESVPAEQWRDHPRDLVVLGSSVGRNISPFSSMYGSTKFAVGSLAEALRRELAPEGIRVSLVEPAVIKSEFQESAGYDPVTFGQFMDRIGPVLSPEDAARTISFIVTQPAHVHINEVMLRPTRQEYP
jgi:NADP-dependent 3-hydroxy acid dehydrogenase YdfG